MVGRTASANRLLVVTGLLLALFGTAMAGDENLLKLMVTDCEGDAIDGANVMVVLHRVGGGVSVQNDTTDDGLVVFVFQNLVAGDVADVTVTPSGQDPDGDHGYTYVWDENSNEPSVWDLGGSPASCPDGWWDEGEQLIQCVYDTSN